MLRNVSCLCLLLFLHGVALCQARQWNLGQSKTAFVRLSQPKVGAATCDFSGDVLVQMVIFSYHSIFLIHGFIHIQARDRYIVNNQRRRGETKMEVFDGNPIGKAIWNGVWKLPIMRRGEQGTPIEFGDVAHVLRKNIEQIYGEYVMIININYHP